MEAKSTKYEPTQPHPHPLTVRPKDLASRIGVSARQITVLRSHPNPEIRLPKHFKVGRGTFWRIKDIEAWVERQAQRSAT